MSLTTVILENVYVWWPAAILLSLLGYFVHNYRKLSHIPGPFLACISDLWRFVHCSRGNSVAEYELHRKYNSQLLRLGPNTISVSDAAAIKTIYGLSPIFNKGHLYVTHQFTDKNGEIMHNLSSTRDESIHARLRRPVNHAYALSNLLNYEKLMDSTTDVFLAELTRRFAETGAECDFASWLQWYAFDVLGEITFSKRFGFVESGRDIESMIHHTGNHMEYLGTMGQLPVLDEWFRLHNKFARKLVRINPIVTFCVRLISQHTKNENSDSLPDFVSRFKGAAEKYPDVMTPTQIEDYAVTNVSAGSDTTAIILRAVMFNLLTHEAQLAKVLAEIRAVLKARPKDEHSDSHITWTEAYGMSYFQACLKESMRLHPALCQILPRVVPQGGIELCGQWIPGGTEVGCNAWTVHRDEAVFGKDADQFNPERWLVTDEEKVKMMDRSMFIFGAGSRTCIGRHVAMLELSKLVPELLRRFEISLVDPGRFKVRARWLAVQSGLDVKLKARDIEA